MNRAHARALTATLATALLTTACSSTPPPPPGPAASTTTTTAAAASSPLAAPTAPSTPECTAFAQAYNATVSPILKGTGATGDIYTTELKDAFTTLAGTLANSPDPYSQTIRADALAIAASPSSYTAMGAFQTDLRPFLTACGMTPGS